MTFNHLCPIFFSFASAPIAELIISVTGMKGKAKSLQHQWYKYYSLFHLTP